MPRAENGGLGLLHGEEVDLLAAHVGQQLLAVGREGHVRGRDAAELAFSRHAQGGKMT